MGRGDQWLFNPQHLTQEARVETQSFSSCTDPMHPPPPFLLSLPTLPTSGQPDLGVLVGLYISLPNPADQGGVTWVLPVGLIIDLQGLFGLVEKESRSLSLLSHGEVWLRGYLARL